MKLFLSCLLSGALAQKNCPNNACESLGYNQAYKSCREYFPDYISEPTGGSSDETVNPHFVPEVKDNWTKEFQNFAVPLLNNQQYTNKAVSQRLVGFMQTLWPFDGWVIVVTSDNEETGCGGYNGIDSDRCFNHWYAGCREEKRNGSATKQCRNEIAISTQKFTNGKHRIALAVQVNKAIDHMRYVDTKHVMWWAAHAEGCDTIMKNSADPSQGTHCDPSCDQSTAACRKQHVNAKFGVSAKNLNLGYEEHKNMAAKLIWQHYRQALDKEWNFENSNQCADWDVLITFCSNDPNDGQNGQWNDIAYDKVNIGNHYHSDYGHFQVGHRENWYGNNGAGQCVTIFVTPFSH